MSYQLTIIAFLVNLCSTAIYQVSFSLQKFAQTEAAQAKKSIYATSKGAFSLFLVMLAAVLHGWSQNNADMTILSVNSSFGIITNIFIATRFLNERFDWKYDFQGLTLIAIGSTMIVLNSNKNTQTFDLESLLDRLLRLETALYGLFILIFYAGSLFMGHVLPHILRQFEKDCEPIDISAFADDSDEAKRNEMTKWILPLKEPGDETERPLGVLMQAVSDMPIADIKLLSPSTMDIKKAVNMPLIFFTSTAAGFVPLSNLLFKLVGIIIKAQEYVYLIPIGLAIAFTATRKLTYVNTAQLYYNQMQVMPVYMSMQMVQNITFGMLCLGESRFYSKNQLSKIGISIVIQMVGIWRLLQKKSKPQESGGKKSQIATTNKNKDNKKTQ